MKKNKLMNKKIISIGIFLLLVLISCNGKTDKKDVNEDNVSNKTETKEVENCGCDELSGLPFNKDIKKIKGSKGLYSGTCTEKDQNNTITRKVVINNGFLVSDSNKLKLNGKLVSISEITCDNGIESNGWKMELTDYSNRLSDPQLNTGGYTKSYQEYKNGKLFNSYEVLIWKASGSGESNDGSISVYWRYKNGVKLEYIDAQNETEDFLAKSKPVSMPDAKIAGYYSHNKGWLIKDIKNDVLLKIMSGLKNELPKFTYSEF